MNMTNVKGNSTCTLRAKSSETMLLRNWSGGWGLERYVTNFNNARSISYRDDIKTVSQDEIAKYCLSAYLACLKPLSNERKH